jgi:hypothetical protein
MGILTKCRVDDIVYWSPPTYTGTDLSFGSPVQGLCRWTETNERFVGPNGDVVATVKVIADRIPKVDGYIFKGTINDLDGATDPRDVPDAQKIVRVRVLHTIRNSDLSDLDKTAVFVYA